MLIKTLSLALLSILKTVGGPGSLGFLLACVAAGLVMMFVWPRNRRLGRRWLVAVSAAYLLLSLPWFANLIAGRLPALPVSEAARTPIGILIVLDGDNQTGRAREAGRIHAASPPGSVLVLGGSDMVQEVVTAGVPRDRIRVNSSDGTTRTQLARVRNLAGERPAGTVGVVASRVHMPRVVALTRAAGLDVVPFASRLDREPPTSGVRLFVPSYAALMLSRDALYEHVALAYYRWRGWI